MVETGGAKAIVFDLDGTLIATRQLYVAAYAEALAPAVGRHMNDQEIMALNPRAETEVLARAVPVEMRDACLERFYTAYDVLHPQHFRGLCVGVAEMLARLADGGHRLALMTGKSRRAWDITCRQVALPAFETCVFADDVSELKPAPEGLLTTCERLNLAPGAVIYVGDSSGDLACADAAGATPAAVLWSKRADERDAFAAKARDMGGLCFETPDALARWFRC